MVVPGVIGYGLDLWLKWPYVLTIAGFAGGMTWGIYQLVRFAERANAKSESDDSTSKPQGRDNDSE